MVGIGFVLSLILLVAFGKSFAAHGALGLRWLLGLATSIAFLRGIGVITPAAADGMAATTALSIIQFEMLFAHLKRILRLDRLYFRWTIRDNGQTPPWSHTALPYNLLDRHPALTYRNMHARGD